MRLACVCRRLRAVVRAMCAMLFVRAVCVLCACCVLRTPRAAACPPPAHFRSNFAHLRQEQLDAERDGHAFLRQGSQTLDLSAVAAAEDAEDAAVDVIVTPEPVPELPCMFFM